MKALLALLLLPLALAAGAAEPTAPAPTIATAAVKVDGRTLFTVRGISSNPADERAAVIAERIVQVARKRSIPVDSLKVVEGDAYASIMAGDTLIMGVFDADAALEGVQRRDVIAGLYRDRIARAIDSWRAERAPGVLL
ncbi:MAG: hypothetical protein ACM3IK_16470, partial [Sphingomonadaceae bacterium]